MDDDVNEEDERLRFIRWRGIRHGDRICHICSGSGRRMYGSTATWHGGMGGAMMTMDVCDVCWGSGSLDSPGVDLREQQRSEAHRIATEAMKLLCSRAGVEFTSAHAAVAEIATELERLGRGRKPRPEWFVNLCMSLSRALREGVANREEYERIVREHRHDRSEDRRR